MGLAISLKSWFLFFWFVFKVWKYSSFNNLCITSLNSTISPLLSKGFLVVWESISMSFAYGLRALKQWFFLWQIFAILQKKILLQIPCCSEKDWARNAIFIKNLPKLPQLTTIWKGAQDFLLWYFEYCQIWQNKPSDDLHLSKHRRIGKKRTLVWMGQIEQKKPTPFPNSRIPISGSHKYHFSTH